MRRGVTYGLLGACLLGVAALASSPAFAQPAAGGEAEESRASRDLQAKRLFAAGRYAEAIDVLARLYVETSNPVYLRNIARCYQRLPDLDRAIASFEEYLLRGRNIARAERAEVRGFIDELQARKRREALEGGRAPAVPAPAGSTAPAEPPPAPAPAVAQAAEPPAPLPRPLAVAGTLSSPPPPAAEPRAPIASPAVSLPRADEPDVTAAASPRIGRHLALAATGLAGALAVLGGVAMATSWSKFRSAERTCAERDNCAAASRAVDSRSRLSKLLLAGAAVSGGAGVTIYLLDRRGNEARGGGLALSLAGRF